MTRFILGALALAACAHNQNQTVTTTAAEIRPERTAAPVWSPSPQVESSQMPFDLPNRIIREPREVDRVNDARIAAEVHQAIVADEALPEIAKDVDVTTVDSVVTLQGRVETVQQRDELVRLARDTRGVRRVDSRIQIVP